MLLLDHKSDFSGFTAAAWKGIFSKDEFVVKKLGQIDDESATKDYFGDLYRKAWRYWRRFRHLEEEELLIFIALPLAVLMFSATFIMGGGSSEETPVKQRKTPTRQQRETTPEIPIRPVLFYVTGGENRYKKYV